MVVLGEGLALGPASGGQPHFLMKQIGGGGGAREGEMVIILRASVVQDGGNPRSK